MDRWGNILRRGSQGWDSLSVLRRVCRRTGRSPCHRHKSGRARVSTHLYHYTSAHPAHSCLPPLRQKGKGRKKQGREVKKTKWGSKTRRKGEERENRVISSALVKAILSKPHNRVLPQSPKAGFIQDHVIFFFLLKVVRIY